MDNKGLAGIGHNQGPPMGGLTSLPVAEKAVGGAILKGAKAGLKSLSSVFESVGSGLKKAGLEKDERKEAAKSIQNEIDKVSKANNRKFRPKVLRMATRPDQDNNFSNVVIAAVDDENGKVAAILDGKFFTKTDTRKVLENSSGTSQRKNKNFGKKINNLTVDGFFPIQASYNQKIKEILTSLNVPVYDKGEGVISPEDLAKLNNARNTALANIQNNYIRKINEANTGLKDGTLTKAEATDLKREATNKMDDAKRKVGMGHGDDKIEMGAKGTLGFTKSLLAGLPITDTTAGRVSGSKPSGSKLDIRGAYIRDTAAPMESLPDIDLSMDLLEEMGDKGLKSLTPKQLNTIVSRKVEGVDLPSNVKRIEKIDKRIGAIKDPVSARKDLYAERLLKEQDKILKEATRKPTIGELYSDETLIEKLQYTLLNRLGGKLSGKQGLGALIKRGDDEMIVGSRSSTEEPQVMMTAEGERLVPRKDFINPRIQKERISEAPSYEEMIQRGMGQSVTDVLADIDTGVLGEGDGMVRLRRLFDNGNIQSERDVSDAMIYVNRIVRETNATNPDSILAQSARMLQRDLREEDDLVSRAIRGNALDDDSLGDNPEPPEILYEMIRVEQDLPGNGFNDLQELEQAFSQGDMSVDVFLREIDAFEESGLVPEDEIREYNNMLSQMLADRE